MPALTAQLRKNVNKLISSYDIYIFLRQILQLSVPETELVAPGCKECKSLLEDIPQVRGCQDMNVPDDRCPCDPNSPHKNV